MRYFLSFLIAVAVFVSIAIFQPVPLPAQGNCDPSYPDFCIAPPPPDLDCPEIGRQNFTVLAPDPHRFDGDKDGIGCET